MFTALAAAARFPEPATDTPLQAAKGTETAVLAGGCFWGMEAIFESLKGVSDVVSGYSGGTKATAQYEAVTSGRTGHAESIRVTYDPAQITFGQILKVYFSVAHDPTQLNRQENDIGPQYRSAIFYSSDEQKRVAEAYVRQLDEAKVYKRRIVTQIVPLQAFYNAEEYHQNFLVRNPTHPYIVNVDMPKLRHLREQLPEMLKKR